MAFPIALAAGGMASAAGAAGGGAAAGGAAAGGAASAGGAGGAASMLSKFKMPSMGGGGGGGGKSGGGFMQKLTSGEGIHGDVMKKSMGYATAALQGIKAMSLKKKADSAFPELVDPNQASYLAELNQKKHALETGADFAEGMNAVDRTAGATNDAITRNAGGNAGGALQALLQSQGNTNIGKNQVVAQGQSQQMNYDNAYGNMLNLISMKRQSLQLRREQQLRGEYSSMMNSAVGNLLSTLAGNGGGPKPDNTGMAPPQMPMDIGNIGNILSGKPAAPATSIETTGVQSPKVVPTPDKTIAAQAQGTPIQAVNTPTSGSLMNLKTSF